ncbi:hypothetical protein HYH02_014425 [Chlamydomonas schloesseri]|uniref:Protein kinase domain-containing protein n=1 Tax=Chlamydomonas schloesseri TaxID=2026947 RepID=A0A835SJE9_9CHLO|nr:hypothetical protein HYH02_014425 [Chlamydomonas schloesseri]|eukprot:KAG2428243.1 hypothetical protein HYH02_014425 [Chlamydomonas schloesseri]
MAVKQLRGRAAGVLLAMLVLVGGAAAGNSSTIVVRNASDLMAALKDPAVKRIELGGGVLNLDVFSPVTLGPGRKVEIVGSVRVLQQPVTGPGSGATWLRPEALQYASGIDFGSSGSAGVFRLSDNSSLAFVDLVLWRGLSSLGYDMSVITLATPGARASVNFTRTIKLRDGCLPLNIFVQHVAAYVRLEDSPGRQVATLEPFCYASPANVSASQLGTPLLSPKSGGSNITTVVVNNTTSGAGTPITCVSEVLATTDVATTITRSNGQSYSLYESHSAYWCRAYASMSCLSASGPEQCVQNLLASVTAGANGSYAGGNGSGNGNGTIKAGDGGSGDGSNPLTGILLPAVLTGVLTLGFICATVWCLHRRGRMQESKRGSSLGLSPAAAIMAANGGGGGPGGRDLEAGAVAAGGGGGAWPGGRVGNALARLLPRGVLPRQQNCALSPGYIPVVSKEALDRIAKVRAELSSKMVVASSGDDLSDVRGLQLVGKGTFGRVYKGEWKGVTVALKVISVPVSQYGQAQWQQVLGEAAISTLLNHPCVLQTYSVALLEYSPARKPPSVASEDALGGSGNGANANNGDGNGTPVMGAGNGNGNSADHALLDSDMAPFYQLKMVSEFCEGGSVVNALKRMRFYDSVGGGVVRLPAIVDIASQVASGMAYLHSANIIHADLKAANVLLKQQPGSGRLQAKVADFGLSFRMEEPEATHVTKGQLGSITHMAPEVLVQGRVSKSSDVYAFGILLYELYTGQHAYYDIPPPMLAYHVATAGGRPLLPPHCPTAYRALAKACWSSDVATRPTFSQIYEVLVALADDVQKSLANPALLKTGSGSARGGGAGAAGPAGSVTVGAALAAEAAADAAAAAVVRAGLAGRVAGPVAATPAPVVAAGAGTPPTASDGTAQQQAATSPPQPYRAPTPAAAAADAAAAVATAMMSAGAGVGASGNWAAPAAREERTEEALQQDSQEGANGAMISSVPLAPLSDGGADTHSTFTAMGSEQLPGSNTTCNTFVPQHPVRYPLAPESLSITAGSPQQQQQQQQQARDAAAQAAAPVAMVQAAGANGQAVAAQQQQQQQQVSVAQSALDQLQHGHRQHLCPAPLPQPPPQPPLQYPHLQKQQDSQVQAQPLDLRSLGSSGGPAGDMPAAGHYDHPRLCHEDVCEMSFVGSQSTQAQEVSRSNPAPTADVPHTLPTRQMSYQP